MKVAKLFISFLILFLDSCYGEDKVVTVSSQSRVEIAHQEASPDIQGAASEPEPVAVAEPNIGALLGISSLAGAPGILAGLGNRALPGAALTPAVTPDVSSLCGSNSDALTNLLVYQYLSGSMPPGSPGLPGAPPPLNGGTTPAVNPQLQALLNAETPGTTSTAVSTTITTRVITLDASTSFHTSTTSYVTTVTQVTSSVLPIIFRGSKITTTITDKVTEVLTATEFKTSSSVIIPSIIQTLPVETTMLHRSTLGLNGQYTLDKIIPGPTKVIERPLSTSNVNLDTKGLDLSSLDLANVDLASLGGGNPDMISALSALLDQYKENDNDRHPFDRRRPNDRDRDRRPGRDRLRPDGRERRPRFRDNRPQMEEEDPPKFNVLPGFTYRDREETPKKKKSFTGTASLSTRYSKFRSKKPSSDLKNNDVISKRHDRESEPFSATTSRRTVSSPSEERRSHPFAFPRNRFQTRASERSQAPQGRRKNREINSFRRQGRTIQRGRSMPSSINEIRDIQIKERPSKRFTFKTTVLTMYMTGPKPGHTVSVERTITLRNLPHDRKKRNIEASKVLEELPKTKSISPDEVINLLKKLDKKQVNHMLESLHKWVDFYINSVIDEPERSILLSSNHISEDIPSLSSSINSEYVSTSGLHATMSLPSMPHEITRYPAQNSTQELCPKPVTLTETVYKTVVVSA